MEYYVIGILIVLIVLSILIKKYIFCPAVIFSGIWLFVLSLSSQKLYGMIDYSEKVIWLILISNISFFIGSISNRVVSINGKNPYNKYREQYSINSFFVWCCIAISAVCLGFFGIKVLQLLSSGIPYSRIRDMLFGYQDVDKIIKNGIFMNFFQWIIAGIVNALMPICLVELFENNKHKLFIILGLSIVIAYTLATAGRITVFLLVIYLSLLLYHYHQRLSKRVKKLALFVIVSGGLLLFLISSLREGYNKGKQVSSAYSYFTICIPLLSHWIEYVDYNHIHTYGLSLVYGIVELLQWGLHALDLSLPGIEWLREAINAPQNTWITVFTNPRGWYNAFCSAIYFWYLDFGYIGTIVIPLVLGFISNNIFLKITMLNNKKSIFYYLLIIQLLVTSFLRFQTITPSYFVSIIIVAFAIKRELVNNPHSYIG